MVHYCKHDWSSAGPGKHEWAVCLHCGDEMTWTGLLVEIRESHEVELARLRGLGQTQRERIVHMESVLHCGSMACKVSDPGRCFCTCGRCHCARGEPIDMRREK